MNSTRITSFVVCLSLASLLLAGNALAGTTAVPTEVNYARESGTANAVYTLPANTVTRAMSVVRDATEDFILKVTLGNGLLFDAARLPLGSDLALTTAAGCAVAAATILGGGTTGATYVDLQVDITTACTGYPTFTLTTTQWRVKDVANVLGGGGVVTIDLATRDSATNVVFDTGTDTADWLNGLYGTAISPVQAATTATVDVAEASKKFVATSPDTTVQDNGGTIGIDGSVASRFNIGGTPYTLVAADTVNLVFTGNLDGIVSFTWDAGGVAVVDTVTAAEKTAQSTTLAIAGNIASLDATANDIRIIVDGTTALVARTVQLTVNLTLSGGVGGAAANNRALQGATNLSVWSLNGTVLIANFQNGNNTVWASRIYLWNPSSTAGLITARVFTAPITGNAETLLGTVSLGTLGAVGGRVIKLAEDILTPMSGVTLPYTTNGGNVVVEITVEASNVTGLAQVFNATTLASFGVAPMQ